MRLNRPDMRQMDGLGIASFYPGIGFIGEFGFAFTSSGSSLTTPSRTSVAGNSVVSACAIFVATPAINVPSDSQANTWVEDREAATATIGVQIAHAHNIAGGAAHTVTITFNTGSFATINAFEYSGMRNQDAEATEVAAGTSTSAVSDPVTASAGSMCVAFVTHNSATSPTIDLTSADWTERAEHEASLDEMPMNFGDIISAGASEQATWTLGSAVPWVGIICAFLRK